MLHPEATLLREFADVEDNREFGFLCHAYAAFFEANLPRVFPNAPDVAVEDDGLADELMADREEMGITDGDLFDQVQQEQAILAEAMQDPEGFLTLMEE